MPDVDAQLLTLSTEFQGLQTDLKTNLDKQSADIKRFGATTTETARLIKENNDQWLRIADDIKDLKSMKSTVDALDAKVGRSSVFEGGDPEDKDAGLTLGDKIINSDVFKNYVAGQDKKSSGTLQLKTLWRAPIQKGFLTSAELGAPDVPFRFQPIIGETLRQTRVRALIPSTPITSGNVEYVREDVQHTLYAELTLATGAADTFFDVGPGLAEGFYPGQIVTLAGASPVVLTVAAGGVNYDTGRITTTTAVGEVIAIGKKATATEFIYTAETKITPNTRKEFDLLTELVKDLSVKMPVPIRTLDDSPQLRGFINARMPTLLGLSEDKQLLYGDGTSRQILGLLAATSGVNQFLWSNGKPGDTQLDAIRRAANISALAELVSDALVINPSDLTDIELLKGDDGHYLFVQAQTAGGVNEVWRLAITETTAIKLKDFLTGAFQMAAMVWDRQQATVRFFEQHEDFAARGMVLIYAASRVAFSILRPKSFTYGQFDAPP